MGQYGKHRSLVGAALLTLTTPAPASACELALVLGIDVSSSVDAAEDALQRGGLARALLSPPVQQAFADRAPVALAVYEWSGRWNQKLLLDWTLITSPEDLAFAAGQIAASERSTDEYPTSLGHALGYGARLLTAGPDCREAKIDLSGDGINNDGYGPSSAYLAFPFDGVTVNGLVILSPGAVGVLNYYHQEVIRGPGAFVEIATGFDSFEAAMERKLVRELQPPTVGHLQ